MHLLDINVLIALCDPGHESHVKAHLWFRDEREAGWATCPVTENGTIRILGHPTYPNTPGSAAAAMVALRNLVAAARGINFGRIAFHCLMVWRYPSLATRRRR